MECGTRNDAGGFHGDGEVLADSIVLIEECFLSTDVTDVADASLRIERIGFYLCKSV